MNEVHLKRDYYYNVHYMNFFCDKENGHFYVDFKRHFRSLLLYPGTVEKGVKDHLGTHNIILHLTEFFGYDFLHVNFLLVILKNSFLNTLILWKRD